MKAWAWDLILWYQMKQKHLAGGLIATFDNQECVSFSTDTARDKTRWKYSICDAVLLTYHHWILPGDWTLGKIIVEICGDRWKWNKPTVHIQFRICPILGFWSHNILPFPSSQRRLYFMQECRDYCLGTSLYCCFLHKNGALDFGKNRLHPPTHLQAHLPPYVSLF